MGDGEDPLLAAEVNQGIREMAAFFAANPYSAYKESDIHWLLAAYISARVSPGCPPWSERRLPMVHREYPTKTVPIFARGRRRGTVDLVVMANQAIIPDAMRMTVRRDSALPCPAVIIEVGLDETKKHVLRDLTKIVDWVLHPESPTGFVCHFFREKTETKGSIREALQTAREDLREVAIGITENPGILIAQVTSTNHGT